MRPGRPNFQAMQNIRPATIILYVFDGLHLNGQDLRRALNLRKAQTFFCHAILLVNFRDQNGWFDLGRKQIEFAVLHLATAVQAQDLPCAD